MYTFTADSKTVSVFPGAEPGAPIIYFHCFSGEGEKVAEAARAAGCPSFTLAAISGLDWNHDMVPWDSPPAFKNEAPRTGGADDYLKLLIGEIIPTTEKKTAESPRWRGIAGYSLAGLFALYAIYRTDLFSRVGSMSGSLWFPGIKEYVFTHEPKRLPDRVYFSLGDKESRTRNPMLRYVRQNTEEIQAFYQAAGIRTVFRSNPGNHYDHVVERTAAGIAWMLDR